MKKLDILFMLLLSATFAITSCKKDKPPEELPVGTVNEAESGSLNLGAKITTDFFGEIKDVNGVSMSDVTVTIGDKTASTDANGFFSIIDASVDEKLAYVKAEKSGYYLGSRSLIPSQISTNAVRITMLKLDVSAVIFSNNTTTVSVDGASVDFKGIYVDEVGNFYSGQIEVAMKFLQGTDPNTGNQMPGMLYAENSSGATGALETYGMIVVELFGNSGQRLQIAGGSDATIHIPVDASQVANAPAEIPLWFFDETAGYWVEEGSAALENGEYVGIVDHFSWWNCDAFSIDAQVCGAVEDASGNPFPNAQVTIITASGTTTGTTNSDGSFCTYIPADQSITFEVNDECGNAVMSETVGPFAPNSTNTAVLVASQTTNTAHVMGSAQNCSGGVVLNGLIEVIIGSDSYYFPLSNGIVNVSLINCVLPAAVDVIVTDYATLTQGQINNVPIVGNTATIGTLNACTPAGEYISLTVDGVTNVFIISLDCYYSLDTLSGTHLINIDGDTQTGDNIYIQGSTLAPGSHGIVQDVLASTGFTFVSNIAPALDFVIPPAVIVNFVNYPVVGDYLDMTMVGTYNDATPLSHSINVDVHIIRDL